MKNDKLSVSTVFVFVYSLVLLVFSGPTLSDFIGVLLRLLFPRINSSIPQYIATILLIVGWMVSWEIISKDSREKGKKISDLERANYYLNSKIKELENRE